MAMNLNRLKSILEEEVLRCLSSGRVAKLGAVYDACEHRHRSLICAPAFHSGIFNRVISNMAKARLITVGGDLVARGAR